MIRISRRFLTQQKKYGVAFLPIEQKYQAITEQILQKYANRAGWGTYRYFDFRIDFQNRPLLDDLTDDF